MLFLRRAENESITIFDQHIKCVISILRVDIDNNEIDVHIDGIGNRTLRVNDKISFLQGEGMLKFSFVLDYGDVYPAAASLGIQAPDSMKIFRTERLTGLGPDQIAALAGG